ncbi:MAG: polyphosphate polymerase domain-containing protein [Bdellovibrionaceae bacterium]|nr:polyphosphate polymerase domain-containing protein [Bdellovibrio sp.]
MSIGPISPLLLDRYELKYLIPFSMVEPISRYVEMFCQMDYYSHISHDKFYTINSLYFETPSFFFLRAKENQTGTFSLRVRSYGETPKAPYFFETKHKIDGFCKKKRGFVPLENWSELFTDPSKPQSFTPTEHVNSFVALAKTYNAQPTILTQYRRKAYLSTIDDYARVTFDRSMRYCQESNFNVHPIEKKMLNYDHPGTFEHPGMNIVLELKCERKIPVWMVDLIKRFDLTRGAFSKFEGSMLECYSLQGLEEFAHGRVVSY